MAGRGKQSKYKKQNKLTIMGILCVLVIFSAFILYASYNLKERDAQYQAQIKELELESEAQDVRGEELSQEQIRVQTKEYVTEIAKTKLGLVFPGEVLLRPKSDN